MVTPRSRRRGRPSRTTKTYDGLAQGLSVYSRAADTTERIETAFVAGAMRALTLRSEGLPPLAILSMLDGVFGHTVFDLALKAERTGRL